MKSFRELHFLPGLTVTCTIRLFGSENLALQNSQYQTLQSFSLTLGVFHFMMEVYVRIELSLNTHKFEPQ